MTTHDEAVKRANDLFACIKRDDDGDRKFADLMPSEQAELRTRFLMIERALGLVGDACRQWQTEEFALALLMRCGRWSFYDNSNPVRGDEIGIFKERDEERAQWREEKNEDENEDLPLE
jgi:hypothetical protein